MGTTSFPFFWKEKSRTLSLASARVSWATQNKLRSRIEDLVRIAVVDIVVYPQKL